MFPQPKPGGAAWGLADGMGEPAWPCHKPHDQWATVCDGPPVGPVHDSMRCVTQVFQVTARQHLTFSLVNPAFTPLPHCGALGTLPGPRECHALVGIGWITETIQVSSSAAPASHPSAGRRNTMGPRKHVGQELALFFQQDLSWPGSWSEAMALLQG